MRYAVLALVAVALIATGWTGASVAGDGEDWVFDPDPEIDAILQEVAQVQAAEERMKLAFELQMTPRDTRLMEAKATLTSAKLKLDACRQQLERHQKERER